MIKKILRYLLNKNIGILKFLFGRNESYPVNHNLNFEVLKKKVEERKHPEPQEVDCAFVKDRLASVNGVQLVDVRDIQEINIHGFIPNMIHIPMPQIQDRFQELDAAKPVIVYCASGMRSFGVGVFLLEHGFRDVSNLSGGFFSWDGEKAMPEAPSGQ